MKVKINSKVVISTLILSIISVISYGIYYCLFSPSPINRYIASNIYKTPANSAFTDDNFYQCVVDAYNSKNHTNVAYTTNLSDSELQTITTLSCYNKGITSASGLEKLTALTELYAFSNQLTSLDVSNNPALTDLSASGNQLTSLDVSNNPALTTLSVYENQLTSLDVSNNPALTTLYANENQLTILDVSNNPALTWLEVYNNQLTSLDVSNNPALTDLSASGNQLTSLDVSNNTALTTLHAYNNQLTSLDVSNNTELTFLNAEKNQLTSLDVGNNTALTILSVGVNQLTSLDVSNNTELTSLNAEKNQLTSLDVSNNPALTDLSASGNQLTSLDVSKNTALTELLVDENQLTSLDVSKNKELDCLEAYQNQLTSLEVRGATSLRALAVGSNQLTSLDVNSNSLLEYLYLDSNQLNSLNLSMNTALKVLSVYNNQLTSLDVSNNTALESLYAGINQLTNLDVSENTELTILNLAGNQLTSLDVSNNPALTYLYASSNQLTNLDISENIELRVLTLGSNQLTNLDLSNHLKLADSKDCYNFYGDSSGRWTGSYFCFSIGSNPFQKKMNPILLDEEIDLTNTNNELAVKLPSQLTPTVTNVLSEGLSEVDDKAVSTKVGNQTITRTSTFSSDNQYTETYTIEVVDITSDKYTIDKTKDYINVGNDTDEEVLNHITVENGDASIENEELIVKNGEDVVKRFKLIRIESSVYDLSNTYLYVESDTDEEIINQIETNANITIDNHILKIQYNEENISSYTLIRLNTSYDLSNHYIYTRDTNILDNINVIHGDKNIDNNNIVISYQGIELDRIPILTITSEVYDIKEYLYTKFKKIDINNINSTNGIELRIDDNNLELHYQSKLLDTIPIYTLSINNSNIRVSSKDNVIYINEDMDIKDFMEGINWNVIQERMSIEVYNSDNELITTGVVTEGDILKVLDEEKEIDRYEIEYRKDYVDYQEGTNVYSTSEYGIDILKNLSIRNTFQEIKSFIETDGVMTIQDKDNQELEETSTIKTGDKLVVTFKESSYLIYLSVKGDVTGTGSILEEDVSKSYQILRGEETEDCYRLATDMNEDGSLKINDVAKLHQYVKNKIESLGN